MRRKEFDLQDVIRYMQSLSVPNAENEAKKLWFFNEARGWYTSHIAITTVSQMQAIVHLWLEHCTAYQEMLACKARKEKELKEAEERKARMKHEKEHQEPPQFDDHFTSLYLKNLSDRIGLGDEEARQELAEYYRERPSLLEKAIQFYREHPELKPSWWKDNRRPKK